MVEKREEYSEEFDSNNNYYILYITEVCEDTKTHINHDRDEIYEEVLNSSEDTYAIYYNISEVQIDKGNQDIITVENDETLINSLFEKIANNYINSKYKLYEEYGLNNNKRRFELYTEYNNNEYIITFKSE